MRDINIMLFAYSYKGVTRQQIQTRFFPSSSSHTPCSERISLLVRTGYLRSQRLASHTGVGSGKAFLTPGRLARPILSRALGIPTSQLGRTRRETPGIIRHHVALCDFRLSCELAAERSPMFRLEEWTGDGQTKLKVTDPVTQKDATIFPDSCFTLALSTGSEQEFYLEIDMGTLTNLKRLRAKLRLYLARQRAGDAAPVLFVVPDARRQTLIARWVQTEADNLHYDPTLVWLTTAPLVTAASVFDAPIWSIVGGPQSLAMADVVTPNHHAILPAPISFHTRSALHSIELHRM